MEKDTLLDEKNTLRKKNNPIGSDCIYCSLEEGLSCMIYFCKKEVKSKKTREVCRDGFTGKCIYYKKK